MIRTEHPTRQAKIYETTGSTCHDYLSTAFGIDPIEPNAGIKALFPSGFQHEDVAVGTIAYAQQLRDAWGLDEANSYYAPTAEQYENALVAFRIRAEDVILTRDTTEASRLESNNLDAGKIEYFMGELTFRLRGQTKPVEGVNGNGDKVIYQGGITSDNNKIAATRADRERMRRLYEKRRSEQERDTQRAAVSKVGYMFEIFPGEQIL